MGERPDLLRRARETDATRCLLSAIQAPADPMTDSAGAAVWTAVARAAAKIKGLTSHARAQFAENGRGDGI